jgi:NAD(P)H-dependent FMN reductase
MKLTLINGSPRGKGSNTKIILNNFVQGFKSVESQFELNEFYLNKDKNHSLIAEEMKSSDFVIIAFPLYNDSMAGIVKLVFYDHLKTDFSNSNMNIGYIIQSGFPEAYHSVFLEKYLVKLTKRLNVTYLGTAIKGGVEGVKIQPRWMTKYLDLFYDLGQHLALEWEFGEDILKKLVKPYRLSGMRLVAFRILRSTKLSNWYWDHQMKKNKAFAKSFAKPYMQK